MSLEETLETLHEQHNHIVLTGFCSMGRLVGVAHDWTDSYYIIEKAQGYKTTGTLIEYVTMVTYCESLKGKIEPRFYDYLDTMFRAHPEWRVEYHTAPDEVVTKFLRDYQEKVGWTDQEVADQHYVTIEKVRELKCQISGS
jgi:hypothetical protein